MNDRIATGYLVGFSLGRYVSDYGTEIGFGVIGDMIQLGIMGLIIKT